MPNRAVAVYEQSKGIGWKKVVIPTRTKSDGKLFLKDDRAADYYISWYEGTRKRWKQVPRVAGGLPYFSRALAFKEAKEWELQHPERVKELETSSSRLSIEAAVLGYLAQLAISKSSLKEHRHALDEFMGYTNCQYVDQMNKAELLRWKAYLEQRKENDELTAVWKLIRVNKFYKHVMGLPHGKGLIKTTEFKSVLNREPRIEIYNGEDLKLFFDACDELQFVLFQLYYKAGLRNKELAHLEWTDLKLERRILNIRAKRMMNGEVKKAWGPKHGSEGAVVLPECVVEPLNRLKASSKRNLVFPTRSGRVNIKLLDQCKLVAKRAGFANWASWKIKSFRSTYATNRIRNGFDLPTVRKQMRHRDLKSIEHYAKFVEDEKLIASGKVDAGWDA
jgi:integrase